MENKYINLYSIYDRNLNHFYSPIPHYNDKEICKEIRMIAIEDNNIIGKCPANFQLFCVGVFVIETGDIIAEKRIVCEITDLADIMESEEENEP